MKKFYFVGTSPYKFRSSTPPPPGPGVNYSLFGLFSYVFDKAAFENVVAQSCNHIESGAQGSIPGRAPLQTRFCDPLHGAKTTNTPASFLFFFIS